MAGTHRANVIGRFLTRNYDYFLVSRDLAEAVRKPTIWDECPSTPHKQVQLLLRIRERPRNVVVEQAPNKLPGEVARI